MLQLQRVTTSGRYIPEIDGLRFVAITAVIMIHSVNPLQVDPRFQQRIVQAGVPSFIAFLYHLNRGVPLFFAISGYIIAQPFLRQYTSQGTAVSLKSFYLRRVTRLEPPYIVSLLLYGVVLSIWRAAKHRDVWHSVGLSLLYVHNFFPRLDFVNPPTWSLEVEIQFYLIAPILALIYRVRSARWRRFTLIGSLVVSTLWPANVASEAGFLLPSYFCFFLVGMLLADFPIDRPSRPKHVLWDLTAPLLWAAFFGIPETMPSLLSSIILFFAIVASMHGPAMGRLLSTRWIALLGGMCYSIYLMHDLVIHSVYPLIRHALLLPGFYANYLFAVLLGIGPILLVSIAFFLLLERPCMDKTWPQKLGHLVSTEWSSRNTKGTLTFCQERKKASSSE